MKIKTMVCCAAVLALSSLRLHADVIIIDQIPTPFVSETFSANTAALSQFDTGATLPNLPNFATAYEKLTFTIGGAITNVSWVGKYDSAVIGSSFSVGFHAHNSLTNTPGALIQSYFVGPANQTAVGGPFTNFYSYSTNLASFTGSAGTSYWMSIVANLNYANAGWGLAFSAIGDDRSVQDFGDLAITRNIDAVDYAVRVTAVPEPSSALCLMSLVGLVGFRRRRSI